MISDKVTVQITQNIPPNTVKYRTMWVVVIGTGNLIHTLTKVMAGEPIKVKPPTRVTRRS